jgi:hypothetical protein
MPSALPLFLVLPIPPLQFVWIMLFMACVVDCCPEYIENAFIDMCPSGLFKAFVESFGIPVL